MIPAVRLKLSTAGLASTTTVAASSTSTTLPVNSSLATVASSAPTPLHAPFPYTYEEQVIMRFPPAMANRIREELAETGGQLEEFSICFVDARRAEVTFHGRKYTAVLLDLPTLLETHKTLDRSQYFKVADVCQMLLVLDGPDVGQSVRQWEELEWQYPHGLTPPMTHVRTRRFKHTSSSTLNQISVMESMEAKVQQMLAADAAAVRSTFTIFDANGRAILSGGDTMDGKFRRPDAGSSEGHRQPTDDMMLDGEGGPEGEAEDEDTQLGDEMGDGSSGDDEGFADEFAAELEEELLADDQPDQDTFMMVVEQPSPQDDHEESQPSPSPSTPVLSPVVLELQQKINERKAQLASVTNPVIRARLEEVIKQLEDDLRSRLS